MYKIQYRRVHSIGEESLERMINASHDPINNRIWEYWNIGEFESTEKAIEYINENYGKVTRKNHRGCRICWFRESSCNWFIQIRFICHLESPWHIGLNNV